MKTIAPPFIEQKTFDALKSREKAYLIFLYQRKYTKKQLMTKENVRNYKASKWHELKNTAWKLIIPKYFNIVFIFQTRNNVKIYWKKNKCLIRKRINKRNGSCSNNICTKSKSWFRGKIRKSDWREFNRSYRRQLWRTP